MNKKILFLIFLTSISQNAHAYLDPGSGNALICLVLSLFGALIYYLKTFFFKIIRFITRQQNVVNVKEQVAIFSEGKNYWYTYKPIIEELINNKIPFIYYSMDVYDPALTIYNEYMHSKYIGMGNSAYAKVGSLRTKFLITTTPNIGCPSYPIRRPPHVKKLCHVWHSISDSSVYHMGALDHYDVALTVGTWVEESLRRVEKIRNLEKKEIIPVGLPYFDELTKIYNIRQKEYGLKNKTEGANKEDPKIILVAPSWGNKSCLRVYGTDFIHKALIKGYGIIIRPHPQSLKVEKDFIDNLQTEFRNNPLVNFDFDPDSTNSMQRSSMMISDKSGVRFDYAFIYEKPVLTLDFPTDSLSEYEAVLLGRVWGEQESEIIGVRLQPSEKDKIMESIEKTLNFKSSDIKRFREKILINFGESANQIINWLKREMSIADITANS